MKKTRHNPLKHLLSWASLGLLLLIGGSSNAVDISQPQDNWDISIQPVQTDWYAGISIRPASYLAESRGNNAQIDLPANLSAPTYEGTSELFNTDAASQQDTGWQVTPYIDDGIGATARDDSVGLSFSRQW